MDVPDFTINHPAPSNKVDEKIGSSVAEESFNFKNDHITDITTSQMENLSLGNCLTPQEVCGLPKDELKTVSSLTKNNLLPGEVYHVVLERNRHILGLNLFVLDMFEGSKSGCSQQKHIYIRSVVPSSTAALDGRIKPGDKLLEVNGISLDELSFEEVVVKLGKSSQVTHLVLERGNGFFSKSDFDCIVFSRSQKSSTNSNYSEKPASNFEKALEFKSTFEEIYEEFLNGRGQNIRSFIFPPTEASLSGTKDSNITSGLHQHDSEKNLKQYSISINSSLLYAKGNFQNTLTSYKSTPNLADSSDEDDKTESCLYRNKSFNCLLKNEDFINRHKPCDLHQNYSFIRESTSNGHQIPAVPIRMKKLKRLEDICNYCTSENTFYVTIGKSSRGIFGLKICGGRDSLRKDLYSHLIRIKKLCPLQPALECGKLALGDVILEVNGTSMVGLTNTEAFEVLRTVATDVTLKVFRPSKSQISALSAFQIKYFSVALNRGWHLRLGFSLCDPTTSLNIFTDPLPYAPEVKAVYSGSVAHKDGRIKCKDRLIQVNGECVVGVPALKAVDILRKTRGVISMVFCRKKRK